MRILQVNKFLYPFAGSERVMFNTTELLESKGHTISHFAVRDPRNITSDLEIFFPSGLDLSPENTAHFSLGRKLATSRRFYFFREGFNNMMAAADHFKPDVAHMHNIYHHLSPSVAVALKKKSVPAVMTLHDFKLVCPTYSLFREGNVCEECAGGDFKAAVANRCVRGSLAGSLTCAIEGYLHDRLGMYKKNIDIFISPSEFLREKFIEMGFPGQRIRVLPNFVFPPRQLKETEDEGYAFFMGRLHPTKGVDMLVQAAAMTGERNFRIIVAGTGEEERRLRRKAVEIAPGIVRFVGFQTGDDLAKLIRGARFGVAPSIWYENCPMVVLEFWMEGKGVIAPDWGGFSEMISSGKNGLLVEPHGPESLASAMTELWKRPSLAAEMGRNGYERLRNKYGPGKHYDGLMEIYEEAAFIARKQHP